MAALVDIGLTNSEPGQNPRQANENIRHGEQSFAMQARVLAALEYFTHRDEDFGPPPRSAITAICWPLFKSAIARPTCGHSQQVTAMSIGVWERFG